MVVAISAWPIPKDAKQKLENTELNLSFGLQFSAIKIQI